MKKVIGFVFCVLFVGTNMVHAQKNRGVDTPTPNGFWWIQVGARTKGCDSGVGMCGGSSKIIKGDNVVQALISDKGSKPLFITMNSKDMNSKIREQLSNSKTFEIGDDVKIDRYDGYVVRKGVYPLEKTKDGFLVNTKGNDGKNEIVISIKISFEW